MTTTRSAARRLLPWVLVLAFAAWIVVIVVLVTLYPEASAGAPAS